MSERVGCGAIGGGILGVVAAIGAFRDGEPWGTVLGVIPVAVLLGIAVVFWITRNMDSNGVTITNGSDDVRSLQRQLRVAIQNAADAEAKGNHSYAAHFRAQAAVLESQLRSRGA